MNMDKDITEEQKSGKSVENANSERTRPAGNEQNMDVPKLLEQHRKDIDAAKVALGLCDYEQATLMLYLAYQTNRRLLLLVDAMKLEARTAKLPAEEKTK